MNKNWTTIFSSDNSQRAELVKALLTHNEIFSVIVSHHDSSYQFGEFEVYIKREDVVKAKYCLSQTLSEREGLQ